MKSSSLLSLDDALAQLLVKAQPLKSVTSVDTFTADGRVLAEDLIPQIQVPSFDNSAMDGYALRVADLDLNEGVNACKIDAAARKRGFESALEGVDCKDFEKKN